MAERRTISPDAPGLDLTIELDPGLEDTGCAACGRRVPQCICTRPEEQRAEQARAEETRQIATMVGGRQGVLVGALRAIFGWRPWWATAAGRQRTRERLAEEERERQRRAKMGDDWPE